MSDDKKDIARYVDLKTELYSTCGNYAALKEFVKTHLDINESTIKFNEILLTQTGNTISRDQLKERIKLAKEKINES